MAKKLVLLETKFNENFFASTWNQLENLTNGNAKEKLLTQREWVLMCSIETSWTHTRYNTSNTSECLFFIVGLSITRTPKTRRKVCLCLLFMCVCFKANKIWQRVYFKTKATNMYILFFGKFQSEMNFCNAALCSFVVYIFFK